MPNVGVIMMEVSRNYQPENNFLKIVRDLATKNNIVLIFDECSSGLEKLAVVYIKIQCHTRSWVWKSIR